MLYVIFILSASIIPSVSIEDEGGRYYHLMLDALINREAIAAGNRTVEPFVVRSLLHNKDGNGYAQCKPDTAFTTIGLEGSGHHLFKALPRQLCSDATHTNRVCGNQDSYPFGMGWRLGEEPVTVSESMRRPISSGRTRQPLHKVLVLMRDMVDSTASALHRFWGKQSKITCKRKGLKFPCFSLHPEDSLQAELDARIQAAMAMNADLNNLKVEDGCSLVINYDLLLRYPALHAMPLARFLGVDPDNGHIRTFLTETITRLGNGTGGLSAPTLWMSPPSVPITDYVGTYIQKSIVARSFDPSRKFEGKLADLPVHCSNTSHATFSPIQCGLAWRRAWRQYLAHTNAAMLYPNVIPALQLSSDNFIHNM